MTHRARGAPLKLRYINLSAKLQVHIAAVLGASRARDEGWVPAHAGVFSEHSATRPIFRTHGAFLPYFLPYAKHGGIVHLHDARAMQIAVVLGRLARVPHPATRSIYIYRCTRTSTSIYLSSYRRRVERSSSSRRRGSGAH